MDAEEYVVGDFELSFSPKPPYREESMVQLVENLPRVIPREAFDDVVKEIENRAFIGSACIDFHVDIPTDPYICPVMVTYHDGRRAAHLVGVPLETPSVTIHTMQQKLRMLLQLSHISDSLVLGVVGTAPNWEPGHLLSMSDTISAAYNTRSHLYCAYVAPAGFARYAIVLVKDQGTMATIMPPTMVGLERRPDAMTFTLRSEREALFDRAMLPYCLTDGFDGSYLPMFARTISAQPLDVSYFIVRLCPQSLHRNGVRPFDVSRTESPNLRPGPIAKGLWRRAWAIFGGAAQNDARWPEIKRQFIGHYRETNGLTYELSMASGAAESRLRLVVKSPRFKRPPTFTMDPLTSVAWEFSRMLVFGAPRWIQESDLVDICMSSDRKPSRAPIHQPTALRTTMRSHQLDSLTCMVHKETRECILDSLWTRVPTGPDDYLAPGHTTGHQMLSRSAPMSPEIRGGMLCDAMGLGKTCECIALMLANPPQDLGNATAARSTLVLCPASLMEQWKVEIHKHAGDALKVFVYHGRSKRGVTYETLARDHDVVIMSYNTWTSSTATPVASSTGVTHTMADIQFYRVIFDEAHTMAMSVAENPPKSARRWTVSATPRKNLLRQLLALEVSQELAYHARRSEFHTLYAMLMLGIRHTAEDACIAVPPLTVVKRFVELAPNESDIYQELAGVASDKDLGRNLEISNAVQGLRGICAGGRLNIGSIRKCIVTAGQAPKRKVEESLVAPDDDTCAVCMDPYEDPAMTKCRHWFCAECIEASLAFRASCPLCRAYTTKNALRYGVTRNQLELKRRSAEEASGSGDAEDDEDWMEFRTKIDAAAELLLDIRRQDPEAKVCIFSNHSAALASLESKLRCLGVQVQCIKGTTEAARRARILAEFQSSQGADVLLLTMRSASSGLNITAANHVIFLDVSLNPEQTEQAIGRVHRHGQTKPVYIYHMIATGTLEERIYRYIQEHLSRPPMHALWSLIR